jgi:hypothetical protein
LFKEITCQKLPYGEPGSCYAILRFPEALPSSVGKLTAISMLIHAIQLANLVQKNQSKYINSLT